MRRVPDTVIIGFLGAGKTSLVRHMLAHADGRRLAVVVNGETSETRLVAIGKKGLDRAAISSALTAVP